MTLSGPNVITIAGPGWTDKREFRVGSVSADWPVNGIGRFSGLIPAAVAWDQGISDYTDLWLRWRSPSGRLWGGIVRDVVVRLGTTVELSASSFLDELNYLTTRPVYRQAMATAGALIKRAIIDTPGKFAIFDELDTDDVGPLLTAEWRVDRLYQVVQRLADSGNLQYRDELNDDWSRSLRARARVGEDKSADILLIEGRHFGTGSAAKSVKAIANSIYAKSADRDWEDAPGTTVMDLDSYAARGLRQTARRYYGLHSISGLAARARAELVELARPQIPLSIEVRSDEPLLSEIDPGDTIRVWLWSANQRLKLTILQIADDEDRAVTTLTGKAVEP